MRKNTKEMELLFKKKNNGYIFYNDLRLIERRFK